MVTTDCIDQFEQIGLQNESKIKDNKANLLYPTVSEDHAYAHRRRESDFGVLVVNFIFSFHSVSSHCCYSNSTNCSIISIIIVYYLSCITYIDWQLLTTSHDRQFFLVVDPDDVCDVPPRIPTMLLLVSQYHHHSPLKL